MARSGWHGQSARHSLAARGVKSASAQNHATPRIRERRLKRPVMTFMSFERVVVNDGYFDYNLKLKYDQAKQPKEWQQEIDEINMMKLDDIVEKYHPKVTPSRMPLRYSSDVREEED